MLVSSGDSMKAKLAVVCVCIFSATSGAFAQAVAGLGGIAGVVRDPSGAAIPAAKVLVANGAKGISRSLTTNDAGVFTAPALAPAGGYTVTVEAKGFAPYEVKDLELAV